MFVTVDLGFQSDDPYAFDDTPPLSPEPSTADSQGPSVNSAPLNLDSQDMDLAVALSSDDPVSSGLQYVSSTPLPPPTTISDEK